MDLEQSLYEFASSHPCINTHCHISLSEPAPSTLPAFLKKSYLNWQFKEHIRPDMDIPSFLELVECNSYFYSMAQALGALYAADQAPLNRNNWQEIEAGLARSAGEPHKLDDILRQRCHYRSIILDLQDCPGGDNALPDLFRPAFRCDMFLRGNDPTGHDLNGNVPFDHLPLQSYPTLQEYLDAVTQSVTAQVTKGAIALKLAIAYERGLDFESAPFSVAQRGWRFDRATPSERKAFEDTVVFHLCQVAGELGIPVQIHTGMGTLYRSNALWLKPLLDACPDTKFVLLHCSYPNTADAMALIHEYSNVYADLSWLPLLSPGVASSVLDELLDLSDTGRIGWGCDAETLEESLGAHRMFCKILARTLSEKYAKGYYSSDTCRRLISQILWVGPSLLYSLDREDAQL